MSSSNLKEMSLATVHGGAAIERFDDELKRVLQNIADINTGTGGRTVTLKIKLKPDRDRTFCAVSVAVTSTMAPAEAFETQIFLGRKDGDCVAFEHNPQQLPLDMSPLPLASVAKFPTREVKS
jgi:hypothetical protein